MSAARLPQILIPLVALAFGVEAVALELTCQQVSDRSWFLTHDEIRIGHQGFGFGTHEECVSATETLRGDIVCSWNGWKYQTYNASTGEELGGTAAQNYYKSLSDCANDSQSQPEDNAFACAWNGKYYAPVSRVGNKQLSAALNGWNTLNECIDRTVSKSTRSSVCGWDGKPYLYLLDGTRLPFHFGNIDSCNSFQRVFGSGSTYDETLQTLAGLDVSNPGFPEALQNGEPDSEVGFNEWKKCEVRSRNFHLAKSENGYLVRECTPDTVYSWGGYEKVQWFKENLPNGKKWPSKLPRGLFTALSAAATFGYGDVPLRIRLKPNVRFKVVGDYEGTCQNIVERGMATEAELKTQGFARMVLRSDGFSFMEYILCSPNLIQSWSFGTSEHFDEIIRDYKWMTSESYFNWEGYTKHNGKDDFIGNTVDADQYNTKFSQGSFNLRMAILRILAAHNAGGIFSEAGGDPRHYSTQRPIYFNPD